MIILNSVYWFFTFTHIDEFAFYIFTFIFQLNQCLVIFYAKFFVITAFTHMNMNIFKIVIDSWLFDLIVALKDK